MYGPYHITKSNVADEFSKPSKQEQEIKTDSKFPGILKEINVPQKINQFTRNNYSTKMKENSGEDLNEPSEYELLRQRNIEKRKSLFQELNLNQVGNVVIWMVHYAIKGLKVLSIVMTNPFCHVLAER